MWIDLVWNGHHGDVGSVSSTGPYWHSRPSVPVPTAVSPLAQLSTQAPLLSTLELVQREHTGPSVP